MHGAEDADDGGEDPEYKVLRVARAEVGNKEAAHIEQRVQKDADP